MGKGALPLKLQLSVDIQCNMVPLGLSMHSANVIAVLLVTINYDTIPSS
jgi:hypothetical protein